MNQSYPTKILDDWRQDMKQKPNLLHNGCMDIINIIDPIEMN